MFKLSEVRPGSIVYVNTRTSGTVRGTVVETERDIKNGLPGIDYDLDNGEGHWAYLDQIDRIVKF